MRNIFVASILLVLVLLSGCAKENSAYSPVKPTDIISESEAEVAIGGEYDLVLENNAVVDLGNNTYKASYVTTPVGACDPVTVEVTYPSDAFSQTAIKNLYAKAYDSRLNKRKIEGIGSEAFVAFPTLNIYENGHYIRITAGSGDTKQQLELLLSLGQTGVSNLNEYLSDDR